MSKDRNSGTADMEDIAADMEDIAADMEDTVVDTEDTEDLVAVTDVPSLTKLKKRQ